MIDKIKITLDENHKIICAEKNIARSGENEIAQLEIELDEELSNNWVYLDFVKPDGETYKTPKLNVVNNVAIYNIPNSLLDLDGTLETQVVIQNEEGLIWKSSVYQYKVSRSINATDDIPNKEDFITEAQTILDETSRLNNYYTNLEPRIETSIENSKTALSIAKGANQCLTFVEYADMIGTFHELENNVYNIGQNVMIIALNVPDLWISGISEEWVEYGYEGDEAFMAELQDCGYVQVGYYELSQLETQKVDLNDYPEAEEFDALPLWITYEDGSEEIVNLVVYKND